MTKAERKKFIEKTFSGTEVGVLVEDLRDDIKILQEGQTSLRDEMRREFKEVREEIADFKSESRSNFKELFLFKKENQNNFKAAFEYLSKLEDELMEIKKEVKKIKPGKTDKEDFNQLKDRVLRLEEKLEEFQKQHSAFVAKT